MGNNIKKKFENFMQKNKQKILSGVIGLFVGVALSMCSVAAWGANDTDGPTWLLDTAGTITTKHLIIKKLVWSDINADDDDLILQDQNNGHILKLKGKAGVDMEFEFPVFRYDGFQLDTIDSGNIQIFFGR